MYEGPSNKVVVYVHPDGTYDFRIIAVENGRILASSRQGYAKRSEARSMGRRAAGLDSIPVQPLVRFIGQSE